MENTTCEQPTLVALDHPSLVGIIDEFAGELRDEQRFFGPSSTPKPGRRLIERLTSPSDLRTGSMFDGRLVAMSRVGDDGVLDIVVVADWRGRGVGHVLLRHTLERAARIGHERIVLRSSRRSAAVAALGRAIGAVTVDRGQGRIDVVFPTHRFIDTA